MEKIVLDTNLLFAALRSGNADFRAKLFSEEYTFYAPKYIIVEIFKHKERIVKNAKIQDENEIYEYLNEVLQRIHFINEDFVSTANYIKAYQLCKGVDENDTPFVAQALELGAKLWTRDERLKTELRRKGFDQFFEL
jgi:predicted nucleic acid-binding protein